MGVEEQGREKQTSGWGKGRGGAKRFGGNGWGGIVAEGK